jgi:hypothetical protein
MATIHVNRGGTNLGTFSEDDVRAGLRSNRFLGTDLGWREGMPAWQPLSQFVEFSADLPSAAGSSAPPAPPPADAPPPSVESAAGPAPAPAAPAVVPPPAQAVTPGAGLPWDRRRELGLFKAFIDTLQMILARPTEAFTAMKREGGLSEPLIYALIGGTFGTVVSLLYKLGGRAAGVSSFGNDAADQLFGVGGIVAFMIFSPAIVAVTIFLSAGLIHLCLMMVGGARRDFETTFRVICFAAGSAQPLQVVPRRIRLGDLGIGPLLYRVGTSA